MKYNTQARHAIAFVENLTLVGDDSGKPVKLLPFQKDIIATIFGQLDRAGKRKIKRVFLMLPRKQAKTFLVACIVLYWLLGRGLKGQQVLSIANDVSQAGLLFNMCRQMVEADGELEELCEIVPSTKRLAIPSVHSFYAALSTESTTKTGFNPSLVLIDEAQDITDGDLIKNITTGRTNRDDYLTIFIGTAGKRKDTPFYAEYEYAKKWKAGVEKNENYFAWIYEADEEKDDWKSEAVWKRVMPAYGKFCKPEAVREEFELALAMPHKENDFKQYMLNLWMTYAGSSWVSDHDWMANAAPPLHDAKEYYAGFDKASVLDTTSLVLFGLNSKGTWDVIPFIWVCEAQVAKRVTADWSYVKWAKEGFLRVTNGSSQDEERIAADIEQISKTYPIKQLSIDATGTSWIGQKFLEMGLNTVAFKQDIRSMTEPIRELEKLIFNRKLCHGGHPVMRWMVNNLKCVTDSNDNIKFSKKHSTEKIDAVAALCCAVGVAVPAIAAAQFNVGRSIYETRGLAIF